MQALAYFGHRFYTVLSIDHINLSIAGGALGVHLAGFQAHALWEYAKSAVKGKKDFEEYVKIPESYRGMELKRSFIHQIEDGIYGMENNLIQFTP